MSSFKTILLMKILTIKWRILTTKYNHSWIQLMMLKRKKIMSIYLELLPSTSVKSFLHLPRKLTAESHYRKFTEMIWLHLRTKMRKKKSKIMIFKEKIWTKSMLTSMELVISLLNKKSKKNKRS